MRRNPVKVLIAMLIIVLGVVVPGRADQPQTKNPNSSAGENPNYMNGRSELLEPGSDRVIVTPTKEIVGATVRSGRAGIYIGTVDNSDINYRINSPVMTNINVQLIWYGNWTRTINTTPSANNYQTFTNNFLTNFVGNGRWTMNGNYYQVLSGAQTKVTPAYVINGDAYVAKNQKSYPEPLSQTSIYKIAKDRFPNSNSSTIYVVLTSSDTKVKGFGTSFCGWHSYNATSKMKYAFVGDPANVSGCLPQTTSPNYPGADAMLSVLVHELEETATDPQLNAWYSANGYENSDKCAWTWGVSLTQDSVTSPYYNLSLNGVKYLIQQGFAVTSKKSTGSNSVDTWAGSCSMG